MTVQEQLDRIREIIEDENRVVTYKLLSKELSISVNDAKSILKQFVKEEQDKKCTEFVVSYCVSGLKSLKLNECERNVNVVCVVPDRKLEDVKASLKVISSEHVYSVQKSKLQSSCNLYTTDVDIRDERHLQSAVKCNKVRPRAGHPKTAVSEVQNNNLTKVIPKIDAAQHRGEAFTAKQKDSVSMDANSLQKSSAKPPEDKTNDKMKPKSKEINNKNALASMFANQATKEKPIKRPESKEKENLKDKDNFLTNKKNTNCKESKQTSNVAVKNNLGDAESKKPSQNKVTNKRPTTRGRKNVRSKSKTKTDEVPAKRRRILVSDSSSSESEEEEDPLANMEIEEPEDPIPSPIHSPSPGCRKTSHSDEEMDVEDPVPSIMPGVVREKKLVSKTFVDEDGYLVTKKVTEIVEHVEKPEELSSAKLGVSVEAKNHKNGLMQGKSVGAKKSVAHTKGKKPSPPKNTKQASLMSFFKKA